MAFSEDLQELHHGEQEYCRESGPLNSRKINTPAAALLNGLELAAAALAAAVLAALIAAIYILSAPRAIFPDSAVINVKIHNRPENTAVEYILTTKEDTDTILIQGSLDADQDTLHFTGLAPGTTYLVHYFSGEDGEQEKLDEFEFTTPGDKKPEELLPAPDSQGGTPEDASPKDPPAVSGNEKDPSEEPGESTETEETTAPTESRPVWWPDIGGGGDDDDDGSDTTKPTTNPVVPSEPTVPTTPAAPTADTPKLNDALLAANTDDEIIGYTCEETHTFRGVLSDQNTISIVQNGAAVADHTVSYDAATQTLTVTFMGSPISMGETASSTVTLTDENGQSVTSSKEITVPDLGELVLEPVVNGDGTVSFTVGGSLIQPSEGSLQLDVYLTPYEGSADQPFVQMSTSNSSFTHTFTVNLDRPGETLTAEAEVDVIWSAERYGNSFGRWTLAEYTLPEDAPLDKGGITFTVDVPYEDDSFGYPQEFDGYSLEAKFANLDLSRIDQSTINVTFTGEEYVLDNFSMTFNPTGSAAPQQDHSVTMDADNGAIIAYVMCPDYMYDQSEKQTHWQAVLTYEDLEGNPHTVTLTDIIARGYSSDHYMEFRIYQKEPGKYLADVMLQEDMLLINPGEYRLNSIYDGKEYMYPDESFSGYNPTIRTEISGSIYRNYFTIEKELSVPGKIDLVFQPHYDWTATPFQEEYCPTLNADGYGFSSELTDEQYNAASGTWSATETHVFHGIEEYVYEGWIELDVQVPQDAKDVTKSYDPETETYTVSFQRTGVAAGADSTVILIVQSLPEETTMRFRGTCESTITYPDTSDTDGFSLRSTPPAPPAAPDPAVTATPGVSTSGSVHGVTLSGDRYSYVEQHTFAGITGYVLGVEIHKNGYVSDVPYTIRRDGDVFTVTLDPQSLVSGSSADSRVVIHWSHENGDPCTSASTLTVTQPLLESSLS